MTRNMERERSLGLMAGNTKAAGSEANKVELDIIPTRLGPARKVYGSTESAKSGLQTRIESDQRQNIASSKPIEILRPT